MYQSNKNEEFIHQNFQKKVLGGFTLVETLVAISILLGSITAPMLIASRGISITALARDQVMAAYLAQDAVEYVMAKKKQNSLNEILGNSTGWLLNLDTPCGAPNGCIVDTLYDLVQPTPATACAATCSPLKFNNVTGAYGYGSGADWTDSRFTRKVVISSLNTHEAVLEVTIVWKNSVLVQKSFTIKTNIFDTVL
ncbi:MAG: type II secretion system protein [Patescibacteria group bacterium]